MKILKTSLLPLFLAVAMSGCSSMKTENAFTGEKEFNKKTQGAVIGGTTGAAVGLLAGGAGAAVGALVGAGVGGYYGYTLDQAKEKLVDELIDFDIKVEEREGVIYIQMNNSLLFDVSDEELTEKSKSILDTFNRIINQLDEKVFIKVSGHTDNTGDLSFNISLSEQRAKKVSNYLYNGGIKASRIVYQGYASLNPVASNDTEEGRAQNRRVEIEIIPEIVKY